MRLQLLGTGSADGWPNPWCDCASCTWARTTGAVRAQTSVLLDDRVLLDCGPDAPRAAARAGVSLAGVDLVLLGHAHPDHCHPQALLWRDWSSQRDRPLEVVAPPAAIRAFRSAIEAEAGAAAVTYTEVLPGDDLVRGGYRLRPQAAEHGGARVGPPVLHDVTAPDGTRLLYASDTAPLPESALPGDPDAPYDVLLLEETHGDQPGVGLHHGLDSFGRTVAALRRRGALTAGSRVIAVHLGHGNPPGAELGRRLAAYGAEVLPDGAVVDVAPAGRPGADASSRSRPYRVLITGGARSGKSQEAERRMLGHPEVTYVATAEEYPDDPEWSARLTAHRDRRPAHWTTVETGVLAPLLTSPGPPLLIDCLGLWLTRGSESPDALAEAWRNSQREVVLVTNEVGSGVVPATASGRSFRDGLGRLNARLAATADEVWHCVAGVACRLK